MTFDAGQNSEPNFTRLGELGLHFVGSIPPSDHPDLLARPATDRHLVGAYAQENLTALDTTAMVLGRRGRVILAHSVGLHTAQQVGFAQTLRKGQRRADRVGRAAGPRPHPPTPTQGRGRHRHHLRTPLGGQGDHHRPDR